MQIIGRLTSAPPGFPAPLIPVLCFILLLGVGSFLYRELFLPSPPPHRGSRLCGGGSGVEVVGFPCVGPHFPLRLLHVIGSICRKTCQIQYDIGKALGAGIELLYGALWAALRPLGHVERITEKIREGCR